MCRNFCVALGALLLAACSADAPPAPPPLRVVEVTQVRQGPAEPPVIASGVAASRDEARLSFMVGGMISAVAVRAGDAVRRGQILARIEDTEIDARVTQADEAHDKARRDLERGRKLFAEDVVTREQLDDLATAEAVARAQLDSTRFNRRHAEVLASADGRVLQRLAEPHEMVQAGQPVLVVSDGGSGVVLRLGLADREVVRVHAGDTAEVRFDAWPGRAFAGQVQEVGQAADPRSGVFEVTLVVDSGDAKIPSGMIGQARIAPRHTTTRTYLPLTALVEGDQNRSRLYVFDPAERTVRETTVAIAFLDGEDAALQSALPADTQVVTSGAAYLRDGESVQLGAEAAVRAARR